jgi:glycosyltransferase involved in cell wall biosynthesis
MAGVVAEVSEAHLLVVGRDGDSALAQQVRAEVRSLQLNNHVSFLGLRTDVPAVLAACDVGVLGSASEGFPVVLLEYGAAGLAAVATEVGQCGEILDGGRAGLLVPPRQPEALAQALITLLRSPEQRAHYGQALRARVLERYSQQSVIASICQVYETVLHHAVGRPTSQHSGSAQIPAGGVKSKA